jgi:murein hydrolase activator
VARKQTRGKQISGIALAARCCVAAVIIAAVRPSPLFALPDSVGTGQQRSAPSAQKGVNQQKSAPSAPKSAGQQKSVPAPQKGVNQQKSAPASKHKAADQQKPASASAPKKSWTEPSSPAVAAVEKELNKTQGALDSIKAELERGRQRFKELQHEEGNYLSRLEQIEKNIYSSGKYADLVQKQIDTTEIALVALGDSLTKAEADLYRARELMKKRLRNARMTGDMNKLQMLLTSGSPSEFVRRVRYFQDLNRYDRRLTASIKESIASVNEKRSAQGENRDKLVKLLSDKKKEQQALVAEEAQRRTVLSDIRTKKSAHEAMVAELEEAQNELDAMIKALEGRRKKVKEEEEERRAAVSFENRKGKLPWPLRGEVVRKFGNVVHPVYKTVTPNNGIDIAAKKGDAVKSAATGEVALVKWMRGYGRCVFIDHSGGYYTLYAHLDEVSVTENAKVTSGAEIGKAGETGTTGGPKLHFEIKLRAESLNPEEWLEK